MATLDRIMELQRGGMSDSDINTTLTNEGVPPAEITDSFNQSKIKNAVSPPGQTPGVPVDNFSSSGMQASMMGENDANPSPTEGGLQAGTGAVEELAPLNSPPMPSAQLAEAQIPQTPLGHSPLPAAPAPGQAPAQEMYQDPGQAPADPYYPQMPQAYPEQGYYQEDQGGYSTDTFSEIAEQVATAKLEEFKAKTGDLITFRNTVDQNIKDLDQRLRRIEATIDKINHAVLGKMAEFGESTNAVHNDLNNLHGTVQKLMDPLVDNINELKKLANNKN